MQNNLFDDAPEAPQSQPVSVLALFADALPMSAFLVAFAKLEVGRFKTRHQKEIIHAMVELLSHGPVVSTADIEWWVTEEMPRNHEVYGPLDQLVARMDTRQKKIARRAAINIIGPSQSENRLRCMEIIRTLLPG